MTETTQPKARKPFRGRRPRRPGAGGPPGAPGLEPGVEGERGDTAAAAPIDAGGGAEGPAVGGNEAGQARGPRPPRPNRHGRNKGHGPRGGRPADGHGEPGSAGDASGMPAPRSNEGGMRQGKQRFERNRGGKGGQPGGQGGYAGRGPGANGAQLWSGKGGGAERGNEARRSRGAQSAEPVRLSSLLVSRGLCSPREADSFVEHGWVIVNGERCSGAGTRVHPAAEIRLAPEARGEQSRGVTILFNKPVDCVATGAGDVVDGEFDSAYALIGPETLDDRYDGPLFRQEHLRDLRPAGTLDVDSMGLLVLTQDERVVSQLAGDDSTVEMEYLVGVEKAPEDEMLAALNGPVDVGGVPLTPVRVARQGDSQLKIVLAGHESRLLRLLEQVGLKVTSVTRVRIGLVRLGDVPQGKWRYLRDDESF